MKTNFSRLRVAAAVVCACVSSGAFAYNDESPAELVWTPSVANDDGSPLLNLAGYYVYTGSSPDTLIPTFFAGADTPAIVLWYPPGSVYYFGVTAVNVDGIESVMSAVVSNAPP